MRDVRKNMRPLVFQRYPLSRWALFIITGLLVMPALAAFQAVAVIPWYIVPGTFSVFSSWVYFRLGCDKKRAQTNQWRVPEANLHLSELLGGWPGSFIAQRRFRHKISKKSYQITFWMIVLIYQVAAFDYLNHWSYTKIVVGVILKYIES